jgi:LysR family glycine cleavage system transcriptional activator
MKTSHLNNLRALEATLRTRSFRAAAEELGVTPAAVGQQVRGLENFLDRKLLRRSTAGVTPTDAAQRVQHRLTTSFLAIEEIIGLLKNRQAGSRVAITLPSSFAENWFTGRLADFYRLNSNIDLRLDASNRMVDLAGEDFDFAIRYSEPSSAVYDDTELFGDHVLPLCTPDFASRHGLSMRTKSLRGIPLVHLDSRTTDPDWADWTRWGEAFDLDGDGLQDGIRLTEFNSGLQAAIRGQGLVLCGVVEAFNALGDGTLVAPFGAARCCPAGYAYRLVAIRGRDLSPLQIQFRDWIIAVTGEFRGQLNAFVSPGANPD